MLIDDVLQCNRICDQFAVDDCFFLISRIIGFKQTLSTEGQVLRKPVMTFNRSQMPAHPNPWVWTSQIDRQRKCGLPRVEMPRAYGGESWMRRNANSMRAGYAAANTNVMALDGVSKATIFRPFSHKASLVRGRHCSNRGTLVRACRCNFDNRAQAARLVACFRYTGIAVDSLRRGVVRGPHGHRLEQWLKESGLTQTQAAKVLGITQARVSDIKRGKFGQFSLDMLVRLASRAGLKPRLKLAA